MEKLSNNLRTAIPTPSSEPCSPQNRNPNQCVKCGRWTEINPFGKPSICEACKIRQNRRELWANASTIGRLELAQSIGVGLVFCRNDRLPSLNDLGLKERIAKNPLPKGGIIAVGSVGSHKSHLLAARTINAACRGWSARYLNWGRFCLEVRDTYKPSATETELDVLNRYVTLDYLAIDDLGVGKLQASGSESEASRLLCYELLNDRYERSLITDVSSNATPNELADRFDDRISRRLMELCTAYPMLLRTT